MQKYKCYNVINALTHRWPTNWKMDCAKRAYKKYSLLQLLAPSESSSLIEESNLLPTVRHMGQWKHVRNDGKAKAKESERAPTTVILAHIARLNWSWSIEYTCQKERTIFFCVCSLESANRNKETRRKWKQKSKKRINLKIVSRNAERYTLTNRLSGA